MSELRDATPFTRWFPALQEPGLRLYLAGQGASVLGMWVFDISLNLLLWSLTRSPGALGVLNFMLYVPGLLITPAFARFLGTHNARASTLAVLGALLGLAAATTVLSATGRLVPALVFGIAALRGVLAGLEIPARQLLIATLVREPAQMAGAMALNTTVFQVARMTGPAVAGLLFASAGVSWAFAVTAVALALMFCCVLRVQPTVGPAPIDESDAKGLAGALRFVRHDRYGRAFLPLMLFGTLFAGGLQTLVPVLADRSFGDPARWTGWFFGALGGGSVAAAVLMSTHLLEWARSRLQVLAAWSTPLALAGVAASGHAVLTMGCFAIIGFGTTLMVTATTGRLHQHVPPLARSGLVALLLTSFNGAQPLAQLLSGFLAQQLGVQRALLLLAAALACAVMALLLPRWRAAGRVEWDSGRL